MPSPTGSNISWPTYTTQSRHCQCHLHCSTEKQQLQAQVRIPPPLSFCDPLPMANFLLFFNLFITPPSMGSNISRTTYTTQSPHHHCHLCLSKEKQLPWEPARIHFFMNHFPHLTFYYFSINLLHHPPRDPTYLDPHIQPRAATANATFAAVQRSSACEHR